MSSPTRANRFRVSDAMWRRIEPLLPEHHNPPPERGGRPRRPDRDCFDAIFFVLRTGCQWNALNETGLCPSSTAHDRFQAWEEDGFFERLWDPGLQAYDELRGLDWSFISSYGAQTKAPLGGEETGPNLTDRSKQGAKRSVASDVRGVPLSVDIDGANVHDMCLVGMTLPQIEDRAVDRPAPDSDHPQGACLDKGYDYPEVRELVEAFGFVAHIRSRGEEAEAKRKAVKRARRWVVERTHSWLNRFRRLLIRWEKKAENDLAMLHMACAFIAFQQAVSGKALRPSRYAGTSIIHEISGLDMRTGDRRIVRQLEHFQPPRRAIIEHIRAVQHVVEHNRRDAVADRQRPEYCSHDRLLNAMRPRSDVTPNPAPARPPGRPLGNLTMKPVRMLIIGCGSWRGAWFTGEFHAHPDYEVVGLVNTRVKVAQAVSDFLGLGDTPIFTDWNEALDKVDCDAALVIYPDFLHKQIMLDLLRREKYVYLEKPMTTNLPDCLEIIRADRQAGGKTMVGFNARYMPLYENLHRLVREGRVGDVLTIQSDEFYYNGRTLMRRWNRLREMGGGLWVTKACHDLDLQFWLTGSLPKTVSASAELTFYKPKPEAADFCRDCEIEPDCPDSHLKFRAGENYHDFPPLRRAIEDAREDTGKRADLCLFNSEKDTFDHGTALTTFENGAIASHTLNIVVPFTDRRMRISGSEGTLEGSLESPDLLYWKRHDGEDLQRAERLPIVDDPTMIQGGHGGADNLILNQFLGFVRGANLNVTRPAEASISIATGVAATLSGDTRTVVTMDDLEGWTELKTYLAEENIPPAPASTAPTA